jgi:hypothetical protein
VTPRHKTIINGPQWRPFGVRVHHGMAGLILVVLGLGLILDDRKDFPWTRDNR